MDVFFFGCPPPVFRLGVGLLAPSESKIQVQGATSGRKSSNKNFSAACHSHDKRGALKPAIPQGRRGGWVAPGLAGMDQ